MSLVTSTTRTPLWRLFSSTNWLMILLSLRCSGSQVMGSARLLMRIDRLPLGPFLPRWIGTPPSTCSGVASPSTWSIRRMAWRHSAAMVCFPVFSLSSSSSTVIGIATRCSWKFNRAFGSWIRTLVSRTYRVGWVGRERPWSSIRDHLLLRAWRRNAGSALRRGASRLLSSGGESLTAEVRAGAATCAAGFGGLRFHKYRKKYDGKKYFSSSAGFFFRKRRNTLAQPFARSSVIGPTSVKTLRFSVPQRFSSAIPPPPCPCDIKPPLRPAPPSCMNPGLDLDTMSRLNLATDLTGASQGACGATSVHSKEDS